MANMATKLAIVESQVQDLRDWRTYIEPRISDLDLRSLATKADVRAITESLDDLHNRFNTVSKMALRLLEIIAHFAGVTATDWFGWALANSTPIGKMIDPAKFSVLTVVTVGVVYGTIRISLLMKEKKHGKRTNHSH